MAVYQGRSQFQGLFSEMWAVSETVDFANAATGSGTFASADVTVPGVALGAKTPLARAPEWIPGLDVVNRNIVIRLIRQPVKGRSKPALPIHEVRCRHFQPRQPACFRK